MSAKLIIVPAAKGDSQFAFYKNLKNKLKEYSFDVYLIHIKEDFALYPAWELELSNLKDKFGSETYLIAHSSGGLASLRFLSENNLKLKGLNLVATGWNEQKIKVNNSEEIIKQAQSFKLTDGNLAIDFQKINKNTEFINLHYSVDDDTVEFAEWKEFRQFLPKSSLIKYLNKGHFRDSLVPELAEFIINQEKNSWTEIGNKKYRIKMIEDQDLPLILPDVDDYQPSIDGRSPLAKSNWIEIKDLQGRVIGRHESDTMPNWAGSSWYYLRYCDPQSFINFASKKSLGYWLPVDYYFGGNEHTTLHLLYSRFWHRFLYDQGYVPTSEPYNKRINGGILLGPDGQKMSKSKGNVINPKQVLETMGADALRLYIAFIGPYEATVVWQEGGLKACKKLVDNIFRLSEKVSQINLDIYKTKQTKYLIFDFDGVIGDTALAARLVIQKTFNLSPQKAEEFQQGYFDKPRHSKKNTSEDINKFTIHHNEFTNFFKNHINQKTINLFTGFISEIERLENVKLAIVSSGSKEYILPMLENCTLKFDYIYDFQDSMSKEEKVEMVCKNWGVSNQEIYYFTDTKSDVLELEEFMDKSKIIGCSWGYQGYEKLQEVLPESQILKKFSDLQSFADGRFVLFSEFDKELSKQGKVDSSTLSNYHKFVKNITDQISDLRNNVAVAEIMTFVNYLKDLETIPASVWVNFLKVLAPFAPFTAEELWYKFFEFDSKDSSKSIHSSYWPRFSTELCIDEEVTIAIQINGKIRGEIKMPKDSNEQEVLEKAKAKVSNWLQNKQIIFTKIIPNKIVTLAIK